MREFFYVYVLRNKAVDYPAYYVGKTKNIRRRLKQHEASPYNGYNISLFANTLREYGWESFELVELTTHGSSDDAFRHESKRIKALRDGGYHLYNVNDGCLKPDSFRYTCKPYCETTRKKVVMSEPKTKNQEPAPVDELDMNDPCKQYREAEDSMFDDLEYQKQCDIDLPEMTHGIML